MAIRRTLTRASTFFPTQRYKKTLGHKFRDAIAASDFLIRPIKKYIFPNFIAVHYFYIVMVTIITSIMIYPVGGHEYTDILFLSAGATTQGGLNTVDLNLLTLYQQIILYLSCMVTTPIFIHGCLAFVRLYWFERYFDDIKGSSKRDFKMRRTRTILERELTARTATHTRTHTFSKKGIRRKKSKNSTIDDFQAKLFSGELINRDEAQPGDRLSRRNTLENADPRNNTSIAFDEPIIRKNKKTGERFEGRRDSTEITPADMYRSIQMLQSNHQGEEEDDGPALVVKPPRETNNSDESASTQVSTETTYSESSSFSGGTPNSLLRGYSPTSLQTDKQRRHGSSESTDSEISPLEDNVLSNSQEFEDESFHNVDTDIEEEGEFADEDISSNDTSQNNSSIDVLTIDSENDVHVLSESSSKTFGLPRFHSRTRLAKSSDSKSSSSSSSRNDNSSRSSASYSSSQHSSIRSIHSDSYLPKKVSTRLSNSSSSEEKGSVTSSSSLPSKNDDLDSQPHTNSTINEELGESHNLNDNENNLAGPTIQFDIQEPPSKRRRRLALEKREHGSPKRPPMHKNKRRGSMNLLRKTIHKGIKKTFVPESSRPAIKRKKSVYYDADQSITTNDNRGENAEDYFADYETEPGDQTTLSHDDLNSSDESSGILSNFDFDGTVNTDDGSRNINSLTRESKFQDAVYQNWKEKHKGNRGFKKNWRRESSQFLKPIRTMTSDFTFTTDEDRMKRKKDAQKWARNKSNTMSNTVNSNMFDLDTEQNDFPLQFDDDVNFAPAGHALRRRRSKYLSYTPTIGRNSTFMGLDKMQRNELGGVEYRSIKLLCVVVAVYYIGFHVIGFVMTVPWIVLKPHYRKLVRADGVAPAWWGFFTPMSAFNNLGFCLDPTSLNSFSTAKYPLLVFSTLIIIGNTGFPIMLRLILWVMRVFSRDLSQIEESLQFLLDHPRRCFTLLFPSGATWWLVIILVLMNLTDLILFIILDFGTPEIKEFSTGDRTLIGFFQGVSTRTTGFTVTDLRLLHPAIQVSYMLMMYVSVMPIAISLRRTNVYEEQSLGIYDNNKTEESSDEEDSDENEEDDDDEENSLLQTSTNSRDSERRRLKERRKKRRHKKERMAASHIGTHVMMQLSFDLWFLFLGLFIICLCEGGKIKDKRRPDFDIFSILFEIVSAYGTVGLSLGYPNTNQSFSAQFTKLSKLVIVALLIRGKHRGLPNSLDRAIILPSDRLEHIDHVEDMKLKKRGKTESTTDPVTQHVRHTMLQFSNGFQNIKRAFTVDGSEESSTKNPVSDTELHDYHEYQNFVSDVEDESDSKSENEEWGPTYADRTITGRSQDPTYTRRSVVDDDTDDDEQ